MKTTLELPDELMRSLKIRAAQTDRKLKDLVADLIRRGLAEASNMSIADPLQALREKLVFHSDGTITNPSGIDDPAFFKALDEIREASRREAPHDPFADFD